MIEQDELGRDLSCEQLGCISRSPCLAHGDAFRSDSVKEQKVLLIMWLQTLGRRKTHFWEYFLCPEMKADPFIIPVFQPQVSCLVGHKSAMGATISCDAPSSVTHPRPSPKLRCPLSAEPLNCDRCFLGGGRGYGSDGAQYPSKT